MGKNWKAINLFLILVLAGVSFCLDKKISEWFSLIRAEFLSEIFLGVTTLSSTLIIFFILTSLFLVKIHRIKHLIPLWITFFVSGVVNLILKISFHRIRPYQLGIITTYPLLEKASHLVWDFSFPSFQATAAFCAIPIISRKFPKFKYVWIFFAVLVAISRVYFGVHFLSDVIIGGLIGYTIGEIILREWDKNFEKSVKKKR